MSDGPWTPEFVENPPAPEIKAKSPFTETQVSGIVGIVKQRLTQLFAEPAMKQHMENAEWTKNILEVKADEVTNEPRNISDTKEGVRGEPSWTDYGLINSITKDNPNLDTFSDKDAEEIAQKVELIKQSRFIDKKIPEALQKVRIGTMRSYLSLRDARDKNASPEKQKRLEEMFQKQRQILQEIAPYRKDPSLLLKEDLKSSIRFFDRLARENHALPMRKSRLLNEPDTGKLLSWVAGQRYREDANIYRRALKTLREKYPTAASKEPPTEKAINEVKKELGSVSPSVEPAPVTAAVK